MPYPDSDWQRFTPWGGQASRTSSAATVVVGPGLTVLTGNVAIATIVPPVSGPHMIALEFAGVAGVLATGNISVAKATVAGEVLLLVWNTLTNKYSPVG